MPKTAKLDEHMRNIDGVAGYNRNYTILHVGTADVLAPSVYS
jgi:hypothetical protein